ncbi:hypothetical protein [Microbacterium deminutum]|uniref:hypothetical protein n=1 Tax=Microbacterium deminutum TaxID=344164 RepID=UPI0031DB805D
MDYDWTVVCFVTPTTIDVLAGSPPEFIELRMSPVVEDAQARRPVHDRVLRDRSTISSTSPVFVLGKVLPGCPSSHPASGPGVEGGSTRWVAILEQAVRAMRPEGVAAPSI